MDTEREERQAARQAETVTVEALQAHTCLGESYEVGDVYEIPVELVDTIVVQGKAKVVTEEDTTRRREG